MENILYTAGEYIILSHTDPYVNVCKFLNFSEDIIDDGVGTNLRRTFRYSLDNSTFSEFVDLTSENLELVSVGEEVWFQFRYVLLIGGPVTINGVALDYTVNPATEGAPPQPPDIQDESRIYSEPVIYRATASPWQPYKLNRAVRLYKDLNLMVNSMFGHDIEYFRVLPKGKSRDVHLLEHSLFEHDVKQCIKVVVPDNQFPDNKVNMGPFGMDWEMPFEVQIDKDYFQTIFGEGTGPQKRDVIFFPRTRRIYEIASSYLFRDFMNEPLYYKVSLIKWQAPAEVKKNEGIQVLEDYTLGVEKLFGEEQREIEEKITNPQQYQPATTFEDPVRSYLDPEQDIIEQRVLNYYNVIAEYFYKANTVANLPLLQTEGFASLTQDKTYYVRPDSGPTGPNLPYQDYYSQKKVKYLGEQYGKSIFEYEAGTSQLEANTYPYEIFGPASSFFLYEEDFSGATGSTTESYVASCTTLNVAERNLKKFVEYKSTGYFPDVQDRSITAWFKIDTELGSQYTVQAVSFDEPVKTVTIGVDRNFELMVGDNVELKRASGGNFILFGRVKEILSKTSFKLELETQLVDYLTTTTPSWPSYTDLRAEKAWKRIFASSMLEGKGFQLELIANRHFVVTLNSVRHWFSFPYIDEGLASDKWYAVAMTLSNLFKQLTLNAWRPQWDSVTNLPATTDLKLMMGNTITIPQEDRSTNIPMYLLPSKTLITNIRIFDKPLTTDKQPIVLNQNIVKDANLALVIDNALPQSKLPKIGYTR